MFRLSFALLLYVYGVVATGNPYFYINRQQGESIRLFTRTDLTLKAEILTLQGSAGIAISVHNPWVAVTYPELGMISFIDSEKRLPLD